MAHIVAPRSRVECQEADGTVSGRRRPIAVTGRLRSVPSGL